MPKYKLQSHLIFHRSEQGGIFFLSLLIVVLLIAYFTIHKPTEGVFDMSSAEIVKRQQIIDSLRALALEARKPKLYPFNPNFITTYKAYTLGMPTEAYEKLKNFRSQDKWMNSVHDVKSVTGVSDAWLDSIAPFFKFPEWITNPKPTKKYVSKRYEVSKTIDQKIDLNKATVADLQQVFGVGPALSKRIVAYRKKLGGFSDDVQLYEVYGLSESVVAKIKQFFTVKTPKPIEKLNINTVSVSDLATMPGVSFEFAKDIWEFVRVREGIQSLSELEKIEGMTASRLRRIQLYLFVE